MLIRLPLPAVDATGQVRRWYLPLKEAGSSTPDLEYYVTYARFLGMGSSYTELHQRHDGRFVDRGVRCNACRWFETRILRELVLPAGAERLEDVDDPTSVRLGDYVLHFAGMSVVEGEVPFCKVETTGSAYTVVELMTTRRVTDRGPEAFIAKPAARALSEAAGHDADLADAYVNRAVS